jgi:hypothetical protein
MKVVQQALPKHCSQWDGSYQSLSDTPTSAAKARVTDGIAFYVPWNTGLSEL